MTRRTKELLIYLVGGFSFLMSLLMVMVAYHRHSPGDVIIWIIATIILPPWWTYSALKDL